MSSSTNRRALRWLQSELPSLVSSGAISEENAHAIERHYEAQTPDERNLGFVVLASVGCALVAAGIILLIAHNWDEFSRPLRSVIAFLPLIAAQSLTAFVLVRRDESKPWRESAAIFNVAAIGTAISLVSQAYQIHGTLSNFILVWILLSLPLVYLLRTTLSAVAYLVGAALWLFHHETRGHPLSPMLFWLLLLLVLPYFAFLYRHDRESRETTALAFVLTAVAAIGLGFTANYTKAQLGTLAFAGFFSAVYICGIEFFRAPAEDRLHPLAFLGGIAIGVMTIVLTFQDIWRHVNNPASAPDLAQSVGIAIELAFPIIAVALAIWSFVRGKIHFSLLAAAFPLVTAIGWLVAHLCLPEQITWSTSRCDLAAAVLLNVYALGLGVELIARGLHAESAARTNFGLLVIAGLAVARFFDSDFSFVVRALGFIVIGLGFLATNFFLFKKRRAA